MSINLERTPMVISSAARLSPNSSTSSNFTFNLNRSVSRITDIIVRSIQLPFTFYTVNSTNNVLTFNNNSLSITITPGNYTTATIAIELKSKMDSVFGDSSTNVSFLNSSFKLTITRSTPFSIDAAASVPASTFAILIGFKTSSVTDTTATSDVVINLSGPNYIVIESKFLTKAIQNKVTYVNNSYSDALVVVPVSVAPGDIISLIDDPFIPIKLNYQFSIKPTDIIDIKIKDDVGNILDLNGADFSMQLILINNKA